MWLFGQLNTLGDGDGVVVLKMQEDARAVMEGLARMIEKSRVGGDEVVVNDVQSAES